MSQSHRVSESDDLNLNLNDDAFELEPDVHDEHDEYGGSMSTDFLTRREQLDSAVPMSKVEFILWYTTQCPPYCRSFAASTV